MKDLDFLQLVIFKRPDEILPPSLAEGNDFSTMNNKPHFIHRVEQVIGQFKITSHHRSFYQRKEMEIMENKTRYLMKITGFFFLLEDYKEKILKILKILTEEKLSFHLTRLDMAWTISDFSYESFCRLLTKVKYSGTIERTLRDKKGSLTRVIFYNSRFMATCYNKQTQIKQKKSKDSDYKALFLKKYQRAEIRFEFRLLSKSELVPMTVLARSDPRKFLEEFTTYVIEKSKGRLIYFPFKLRKILFNKKKTKEKA